MKKSQIDQLCKKEIQTLCPIDGVYKDLIDKRLESLKGKIEKK